MFDRIAFRYDFLNRFLSGGIDIYWRRRAIRELAMIRRERAAQTTPEQTTPEQATPKQSAAMQPAGEGLPSNGQPPAGRVKTLRVLDVATGTGDMAIMMTRHLSPVYVTGIDISTGMLDVGRQKLARLRLEDQVVLQTGDSEAIPFTDNSFDAITVAFGVRNFENLEKGLQEMRRALRPGGRLVILEFSQPRKTGFKQLYRFYLKLVAPRLGKMVASSGEAYQYLNDSVMAFPEGEAFREILERTGYVNTRLRRLSMGICTIYVGEK